MSLVCATVIYGMAVAIVMALAKRFARRLRRLSPNVRGALTLGVLATVALTTLVARQVLGLE
jgi:hypothetical protein